MRLLLLAIFCVSSLCLFSVCRHWPGSETSEPRSFDKGAWDRLKAKALRELVVAAEWGTPELIRGEVNSAGWEDSIFISPDGRNLHFAYFPGDLLGWATRGKADPANMPDFRRGPARGVEPACSIDILRSDLVGDRWSAPKPFRYSKNRTSEGGPMRAGGRWYYQSNQPGTATDHDDDLFVDGRALPINTPANEFDPHFVVSKHGRELVFWSDNRPGALGGKDLWLSTETAGKWAPPKPLPAPVNRADSNEWTPHLTNDGRLFFISDRNTKRVSIWESQRRGKQKWTEPRPVISPAADSRCVVAAEPSLTADGKWLYFVVVFMNADGDFDSDVARVRRKK